MPRYTQRHAGKNELDSILCPVHTSNNFEATFGFVAKNGNDVERVYRKISFFWQRLRHCCRFWQQCWTKFRFFDKVETNEACSICFDFVERIVRLLVAIDNIASTLLLVWAGLYVNCFYRARSMLTMIKFEDTTLVAYKLPKATNYINIASLGRIACTHCMIYWTCWYKCRA